MVSACTKMHSRLADPIQLGKSIAAVKPNAMTTNGTDATDPRHQRTASNHFAITDNSAFKYLFAEREQLRWSARTA
jgi:hypothetical protein